MKPQCPNCDQYRIRRQSHYAFWIGLALLIATPFFPDLVFFWKIAIIFFVGGIVWTAVELFSGKKWCFCKNCGKYFVAKR